jgi:hypothetical protein
LVGFVIATILRTATLRDSFWTASAARLVETTTAPGLSASSSVASSGKRPASLPAHRSSNMKSRPRLKPEFAHGGLKHRHLHPA